jgi:adenylate kinase family enzyme
MNKSLNNCGLQSGERRVVEIIGPAGAGKTTLCQGLDSHTPSIRLVNFPNVRNVADIPFFLSNAIPLIPGLLRLYSPGSRPLTRREFARMTILHGWPARLRTESNRNNKTMILDQGPVYLLAEMRLFGPEFLRQKPAERLWSNLYDRWSATLHMVVWLDADDHILLGRIRNRRQEHIVKAEPSTVVYEFLHRYRAEYEFILSKLTTKKSNIKTLRFDTGRQHLRAITNQFLSELSC